MSKEKRPIHYLQIVDDRPQLPLRKKCMDSVKAIVRPGVDKYEVMQIPWNDNPYLRVQSSEYLRFDMAKKISNLCYIDSDCFIHKPFRPPENGKPFFGEYSFNFSDPGIPDIYYFFVNGNTDFFKQHFAQPFSPDQKYSIDMQVLRSLTDFGLIPESSFVHCYNTMNVVYNQSVQETKKTTVTVDELELTSLKRAIELIVLNMRTFDELRSKNNG